MLINCLSRNEKAKALKKNQFLCKEKWSFGGWILFLGIFLLTSCYKQKDTGLAVYVKDINGYTIEGASVHLYGEPTSSAGNLLLIDLTKTTDKNGTAYFDLNSYYKSGQTGVAVLKIDAAYMNKVGSATITIEQETINSKDVVIQ